MGKPEFVGSRFVPGPRPEVREDLKRQKSLQEQEAACVAEMLRKRRKHSGLFPVTY